MTPELESKLIEVVDSLTTNLSQVKSIAIQELPDVVQQFLTLSLYSSLAIASLSAFFAIFCAYMVYKLIEANTRYPELVFVAGIGFFLGITIALTKTITAIKIIIAPKVWLLQNIHELIPYK